MKEIIHPDWERIKKVIDAYGVKKGFKKGEFLSKFIAELDEYHDGLPSDYHYLHDLYVNVITAITKTYPLIPLKKFLDDDGSYLFIDDQDSTHLLNQEIILQDWRDSFKK
jgi:sulfur relay (sulfurtransferase) DsrF/TusC family protein